MKAIGCVAVVLGVMMAAGAAGAELAIFDAHIHFSGPDWTVYSAEQALEILARAGVRRAIVSSTPDDGTLKLYEKSPKGIVPFLRPYRTRDDMSTWARDPEIAAYVEERVKRGVYRGIGELHMDRSDVDGATVKRLAAIAAQRDLFFQAHVDDETMDKLLTVYPNVRMLWAHAGMSASASTVGTLLDRYPRLWVELALRSDVAPGGTLDPEWRAVFIRHADRFLVGTDTWVTSRWESVVDGTKFTRDWLGQLPPDVAEKIAWRNGDRLFPVPER
jgi:hypothetical protein